MTLKAHLVLVVVVVVVNVPRYHHFHRHRHGSFGIVRPSCYGHRGSDRRGIKPIVQPNSAALGLLLGRIGFAFGSMRYSQWCSLR